MSQEQNTQWVQDAYAVFQRGDIPALLNLLTDDVSWFVPGPKDVIPFLGQRRGRDQVVSLGHYRWRVKSTGRRFESDFAHVFTVRNGKISGFHEYADTHAAVNAYSVGQAAAR